MDRYVAGNANHHDIRTVEKYQKDDEAWTNLMARAIAVFLKILPSAIRTHLMNRNIDLNLSTREIFREWFL